MFRRVPLFSFLTAFGLEDESVNLLQTTVHKHLMEQHVAEDAMKKCVVKGDPHVKLWSQTDEDGARMGLYGTYADYWLVHTDYLKVMGRMGGVEQFDMAVVKGVAISGSLIGDKVLLIPTLNNGHLSYDDDPILGDEFPYTNGNLTITNGIIPNYNLFGSKGGMKPRENGFTISIGSDVEIQINQDTFQHLQILAKPYVIAGDSGACTHECPDWFNCPGPICDLKDSLFDTPHEECGHVVIRTECNPLRKKIAIKTCNAKYSEDPPSGVAIQNCIEDCCTDRDQCPDRGKSDGTETCLIFGDPHIKTFDATSATVNTYSPIGTHYLVKSEHLDIQANYVSEDEIKAQISGLAFTGDLVGDKNPDTGEKPILYIAPKKLGGGIFYNGVRAIKCTTFAKDCSHAETHYADPNGHHFDIIYGPGNDIPSLLTERTKYPQRNQTYTIKFTEGGTIVVHEGLGHSIYISLESHAFEGASGECGNADGNHDNDITPDTGSKINCALQDEIFIPKGAECSDIALPSCKKKKQILPYRKQCLNHFGMHSLKKARPSERKLVKACMRDCCYGGSCPNKKNDFADDDY